MSGTPAGVREQVCRRCWVSGRVQGVFFRASTAERARTLGITGWARNLPDGRVEVLACGAGEAVRSLVEWLDEGPRGARVDRLVCEDAGEVRMPAGFTTR